MPSSPKSDTLLEYLAWQLGCTYLSDLRYATQPQVVRQHLSSSECARFPLADWRDAYRYLLGEEPPESMDLPVLRQCLIAHYGKSKDAE